MRSWLCTQLIYNTLAKLNNCTGLFLVTLNINGGDKDLELFKHVVYVLSVQGALRDFSCLAKLNTERF